MSFPNSHAVREALTSVEFLVVQDLFLTETAKMATVVLPSVSFVEKEGSFTNFEGKTNRLRKVIKPVGISRPDWEIVSDISTKMKSSFSYAKIEEIMEEIEETIPGYEGYVDSSKRYQGDEIIAGAGRQQTGQMLRGFARFSPVEYQPLPKVDSKNYPLTLLTGSVLPHIGTGMLSSKSQRLKKLSPPALLDISVANAKKLDLHNGDTVIISSRSGKVEAPVRISNDLPEDVLFMPCTFSEIRVNELFETILDPQSKTPASKACAVQIEKVENHD